MRTGLLLLCLLMLQGCGTLERADGPPPGHVDASNVPDAVPRAEPRSRSGNPDSYVVFGQRYYPLQDRRGFVEKGVASWYGRKFHGKLTSSGEPYHMLKMTAAHKTLPLPSYVRVTNLKNGLSIVVRVNDRGPFAHGRIIDLSYAAASKLDMLKHGTAPVEIRVIDPSPPATTAAPTSTVSRSQPLPAPSTEITAASTTILTSEAATEPGLWLQIGAYSSQANADKMEHRLRDAGLRTRIIAPSSNDTDALFRVQVGPLNGDSGILTARAILKELGLHPTGRPVDDTRP